MMLRNAMILAALVLTPCLGGCAASQADGEDTAVETSQQDLSHQSISAAVNRAFSFFEGPKAELTIEMRSATLPRGLRTKVAAARRGIFAKLSEGGYSSNDVEHMNVYAVYTTASKRTLAGYALWVHANNGSSGAAYLVAFDSRGATVVEKDDWYQDDQDWE
jgi:hypothetical protein